MTFEEILKLQMDNVNAQRVQDHKGMTISEMVAILKTCDPEKEVWFDFEYLIPTGFDSYRGYYSDLAIKFAPIDRYNTNVMTCKEFTNKLKECIGKEFTGYKGGEFTMSEDTPVWVANYGNSGGTGIIGITETNINVILHTALIDVWD